MVPPGFGLAESLVPTFFVSVVPPDLESLPQAAAVSVKARRTATRPTDFLRLEIKMVPLLSGRRAAKDVCAFVSHETGTEDAPVTPGT